jgi:hypothetical protein
MSIKRQFALGAAIALIAIGAAATASFARSDAPERSAIDTRRLADAQPAPGRVEDLEPDELPR